MKDENKGEKIDEAEIKRRLEYSAQNPDEYIKDFKKQEEDLNKTMEKKPSALASIWSDICLLKDLILDYISGRYTDIPKTTLGILAGAMAYLGMPIDVVPDFIPIAGFADDFAVLSLAIKQCWDEIQKYKIWKEKQDQ